MAETTKEKVLTYYAGGQMKIDLTDLYGREYVPAQSKEA